MKNLHLIVSVIVIVPIACWYGFYPMHDHWMGFDFTVDTKDLSGIFCAITGLYLSCCVLWILGIYKPGYWQTATITNIVFMGGLGIGRLVSLFIHGKPNNYLFIGMFLELLLALLAIINLRKQNFRR